MTHPAQAHPEYLGNSNPLGMTIIRSYLFLYYTDHGTGLFYAEVQSVGEAAVEN